MRIAACTMIRDEEQNILEWMAFHYVMGFDELIVIDNGSSDQTSAIVRNTTLDIPVRLLHNPSREPDRQSRIYEHVCRMYAAEFEWIAFLDGDEFIVPADAPYLKHMLARHKDHAAVALGWSIYGSSGHVHSPAGLVIENFQSRAPLDFAPNRHVKSIVRPGAVIAATNPHVFAMRGSYKDVDGTEVAWLTPGLSQAPLADRSWRINHYLTRSAEHWQRRLARRQPGNNVRRIDEFDVYDRNEVLDPTAARFAPLVHDAISRSAMAAGLQ